MHVGTGKEFRPNVMKTTALVFIIILAFVVISGIESAKLDTFCPNLSGVSSGKKGDLNVSLFLFPFPFFFTKLIYLNGSISMNQLTNQKVKIRCQRLDGGGECITKDDTPFLSIRKSKCQEYSFRARVKYKVCNTNKEFTLRFNAQTSEIVYNSVNVLSSSSWWDQPLLPGRCRTKQFKVTIDTCKRKRNLAVNFHVNYEGKTFPEDGYCHIHLNKKSKVRFIDEPPTKEPSVSPSKKPTKLPTAFPTQIKDPTSPTLPPTPTPTQNPTPLPTPKPTLPPTPVPTVKPSQIVPPTVVPTSVLTLPPTSLPTSKPTQLSVEYKYTFQVEYSITCIQDYLKKEITMVLEDVLSQHGSYSVNIKNQEIRELSLD